MFKSVVNIPAPESDHLRSQSSLAGAQLRSIYIPICMPNCNGM